jgi:hypothetical protein
MCIIRVDIPYNPTVHNSKVHDSASIVADENYESDMDTSTDVIASTNAD